MFKKLMLFIMSFGMLSSFAYAGESWSLSGQVSFQYEGDIYVCLLTKEGFRDFQTRGHKLSSQECKVTKWNTDVKKAGKISFKLEDIPKGIYCIVAYQDVNNNGKVDYENYVIVEPWQSFQERNPVMELSTWDEVRFDLEKDITGIEIHMQIVSEGIEAIGEWVEVNGGRSFRVIDIPDAKLALAGALPWTDIGKLEMIPVMDSEEAVNLAAQGKP